MFVDESEESSKILVVSGVIFNPDSIAPFFKKWREILPNGELRRRDSALARRLYTSTIEYVFGVYDLIIPVDIYEAEFDRWVTESVPLQNRILSASPRWPGISPGELAHLRNRRYISYIACCSFFEQLLARAGFTEPVDLCFDEYSNRKFQDEIRRGYEVHRNRVPAKQRALMGASPKFVYSKDSPHIQFADLWAWWRRKMVIESGAQHAEQIAKSNPVPPDWGGDPIRLCTYWDQADIQASFRQKLGQAFDLTPRIHFT